ncbi:uncharacterized protein B0H64DRAFT_170825 [Chaetomium fimeti]|uniref:Uncharacterized protein n=1 Tax=Chaetomium fimeti TaxID=1854472 RepID=A0AAE0HHB7_9PEZI|nr:hypothetical protein B0H64DRAFT_170825 [Chaetomium fimeti]
MPPFPGSSPELTPQFSHQTKTSPKDSKSTQARKRDKAVSSHAIDRRPPGCVEWLRVFVHWTNLKAWWQSGLMRKTRNLVPSGASVRIRSTSKTKLIFWSFLICVSFSFSFLFPSPSSLFVSALPPYLITPAHGYSTFYPWLPDNEEKGWLACIETLTTKINPTTRCPRSPLERKIGVRAVTRPLAHATQLPASPKICRSIAGSR